MLTRQAVVAAAPTLAAQQQRVRLLGGAGRSAVVGLSRGERHVASAFTLPPLPYDYKALEPHIDATTMEIHHTKHHQTYINNLNGVVEKNSSLGSLSLEDLNRAVGTDKLPKDVAGPVRNNGGGHWNHSFFWKVLTPKSSKEPPSELKSAIDKSFGSVEDMKKKFNAAAASRFGSGWAWLAVKSDKSLIITSSPNQDNPLMANADDPSIPILGLDVWEHAYYLKYQNKRPEYIAAFWNVVNWDQVNENYNAATAGKVPAL